MKLTGLKGNVFYGTSDGEFIRQRYEFLLCSFCFRQFEFNERVIRFHTNSTNYFTCLDHEQQMRDRQIISFEEKIKSDKEWEIKKRALLSDLKINKRKNDNERSFE